MDSKQEKTYHVLIAAGGTGGHVFPALAVAHALKEKGYTISWMGTPKGIENRLVPAAGIDLDILPIAGLRGKGPKAWFQLPYRLYKAISIAKAVIRNRQPDLVMGFGGFVTGPAVIAAKRLKIPVVLHEQNTLPGMTNRFLARSVNKVLSAFDSPFSKKFKAVVTGNPIRESIAALYREPYQMAQEGPLHLLVIGGSLGAQTFNTVIPKALALLPKEMRPMVWHQTGEKTLQLAYDSYAKASVEANIVSFIDDMAKAYAWAHIVISRAGALSVSELASSKKPALLVPYPYAVDDHQYFNALQLTKAGGAVCMRDKELSPDIVAAYLKEWHENREKLIEMSIGISKIAEPNATEKVVLECETLLKNGK